MKHEFRKIFAALLTGVICLSLLTACTSSKTSDKTENFKVDQNTSEGQNSPDISDTSNVIGLPTMGLTVNSVGDFTTQDLNGNTVTRDIFKDYDLTMVNVFTTWCSPCVAEMPDLEKLYQQMKNKNVGVVGVVLNVLNEKGEIVKEDLERAQFLVKKTCVTYPILLPDSTYFNNHLTNIEGFPYTFFVDKNGNIVGENYCGSGSLEDWIEVVERELANLKEGA